VGTRVPSMSKLTTSMAMHHVSFLSGIKIERGASND
jgi:hypothetical protein